MTTPFSASNRRFSGESTAPPPVASTMFAPCTISASIRVSRARKPASPSNSKITGIRTPVERSISRSQSKNVLPRRFASNFPMEVLPAPINPTRKMFSPARSLRAGPGVVCDIRPDSSKDIVGPGPTISRRKTARARDWRMVTDASGAIPADSGRKKGGLTAAAFVCPGRRLLAQRQAILDDLRGNEDQQLRAIVDLPVLLEQEAHVGQVAQHRHLVGRRALLLGVDAADHHRAAILDQHLGHDLLGCDRRAGQRFFRAAVLVYVQVHDHVVIGRDLRFYLEGERRFLE